jgi:hypothetical protein
LKLIKTGAMNKLVVQNGGMPLHGDDFGFVHNGLLEAFKGALSLFGETSGGNFIISGCEVTQAGVNVSITTGFAVINWEIVIVPALSISNPSSQPFSIKLEQTWDPAGNKVFADSAARDTYAIRRGVLSLGSTPGNEVLLSAAHVRLGPRLVELIMASQQVQFITSFQTNFGPDLTEPMTLKKHLNRIYLEGYLRYSGASNNAANLYAFEIPAGFRPANDRFFIGTTTENDLFRVSVFANGQVFVQYYQIGPVDWAPGVKFNFSWTL